LRLNGFATTNSALSTVSPAKMLNSVPSMLKSTRQ
jgi:hypothetical protein